MNNKPFSSKVRPVLFLTLLFLSHTALAENYQSSLNIYHSTRNHTNYDADYTGISGIYYWSPIKPDRLLAESAFLAKASGISFSFAQISYDPGPVQLDGPGQSVSLSYVFRQQGIHIGMSSRTESLTGMGIKMDSDFSSFSIGRFFGDRLYISLYHGTGTDTLTANPDIDSSSTGISIKRLTDNVNFEAGFSSDSYDDGSGVETNNEIGFSADFYLENTFSIGLGFSNNRGDSKGIAGTTFSLNLRKFINTSTSFGISYDSFSADSGNYSSTFYFSLSTRI